MGPTTALGAVLAVVAFVVAGSLWYQLFGMELSVWVGLAAGGFTFKYFYDKDQAEVKALLNPPEQVWPVPYTVAWGCIMDVLKRSGVQTGTSGTSMWTIAQEDDTRGIIQAKLAFTQILSVGQNAKTFIREIHLNAQLTPADSTTRVKLEYQFVSPSGAGMVRQLIAKNQSDFNAYVQENRIQ